jgi:hypothetical protein
MERSDHDLEHCTWTGREALIVFENEIDLTIETLAIFEQFYKTILQDTEKDEPTHWTDVDIAGPAVVDSSSIPFSSSKKPSQRTQQLIMSLFSNCKIVLERFFVVMRFMTKKDSNNIDSYRVVIQRSRNSKTGKIESSLNLWCLSAHIAFETFSSQCHSIILTSGTLSPLDSFEKELGVIFPIRVEAQHVIDTTSQVYVNAVSMFDNTLMTSSYLNQRNLPYLDTIGRCILSLVRVTTQGGVLAFFSSFSFLDRLQERWSTTQFLEEFNNRETYTETYHGTRVFYEPKESEKLVTVLTEYYEAIDQGKQCLFLAVCRGKVSEGIDFSDNYARTVIIIGIPFPSLTSLQVKLKRSYLDEMSSNSPSSLPPGVTGAGGSVTSKYLTGDQWYDQQAFRAVNQAFGRCIRHMKDFGVIILCDPRYQKSQNQQQLSRWVRSNIRNTSRVEDILLPIRGFLSENYERFAEHLAGIEEKCQRQRGQGEIAAQEISMSSTKKRKKQVRKLDLSYEEEGEGKTRAPRRGRQQQTTLSQIYSRYHPNLTSSSVLPISTSVEKQQLIDCLLQWDWESHSPSDLGGDVIELSHHPSTLVLQDLPPQLRYLHTHFGEGSEATTAPPLPRRAVRISDWSWPVASPPISCACRHTSVSQLLCVCQLHVVEEWIPQDRVVYRLLLCPPSVRGDNENRSIVFAAKVLAVGEVAGASALLNASFVNWKVVREIFSDHDPSPPPLSEGIVEEDENENICLPRIIDTTTSALGSSRDDHQSDDSDDDFEPNCFSPQVRKKEQSLKKFLTSRGKEVK